MKTISKDLWESVFLLLTERQAGHSDHDPAGRPGRIDAQQGGPGLVFSGPEFGRDYHHCNEGESLG